MYLWKTIIPRFRSQKKIVLSVASSGIAALLLLGGRTSHSRFKIPFDLDESSRCPININSDLAQLIQATSLIIWDEAPMMHRHGFEAVNKTLKDLLKGAENFSANKPFCGKLCVLGGDFKQINMRLMAQANSTHSHDQLRSFAEWINLIGEGRARCLSFTDGGESDWIEIPEEFLIENSDNSLMQLINETYPKLSNKYNDCTYLKERAILTPKNSDVDEINSMMLSMLPGEIHQFCSADILCPGETSDHEQNMNSPELLNSIKVSGIPNHCLELKKGAPIMLMRNLNQSLGLCNGTRLIVSKMGEKVLEARVITGSHMGEEVLIPRIVLTTTQSQTFVPMKRRQFPIKLAFAMTINKSQGQTLDRVGLYLPEPVFTHGQLYVALSRVTNPLGLRILICNKPGIPRNCKKNILYPEVLAAIHE
ncbi:UNVERIFIED_CONTAM: ATP-dependent DNA helicase PIF1 [Sesamum radiatum]|uniref:ATP-dependent DNA helicase n=1 Tax=Sesamum radiatum TaxID=300843 RepID=A0AAW2S207_SESRA